MFLYLDIYKGQISFSLYFFLKFKLRGVIECTSYGLHFCCNGKLPYQYNLQFFGFYQPI